MRLLRMLAQTGTEFSIDQWLEADVSLMYTAALLGTENPFCKGNIIPASTKHLYIICTMLDQRRRRWADVVQMLYKCFVFPGLLFVVLRGSGHAGETRCW